MKILYGIQGTGNGHLSRALEIIPALQKKGDVDLLVSGQQSDLKLPFELKYSFKGLGFVFGKKGGIDLVKTYRKTKLKRFHKEVKGLDVRPYDLILSDFEPITAWSSFRSKKLCIGLSNQASLLHPDVPKANSNDFVGRFIISNYAPCAHNVGFSYANYGSDIFTPVIRKGIRHKICSEQDHHTVYLPSFSDDRIFKTLSQIKSTKWHVFSKHTTFDYEVENVQFFALNLEKFENSITGAKGIVSAAGFGTTTESLHMGKKLLVIPQKNQYEQACNARALEDLGVTIVKSIKEKHLTSIKDWVARDETLRCNYQDITKDLVNRLVDIAQDTEDAYIDYLTSQQYQLGNI